MCVCFETHRTDWSSSAPARRHSSANSRSSIGASKCVQFGWPAVVVRTSTVAVAAAAAAAPPPPPPPPPSRATTGAAAAAVEARLFSASARWASAAKSAPTSRAYVASAWVCVSVTS